MPPVAAGDFSVYNHYMDEQAELDEADNPDDIVRKIIAWVASNREIFDKKGSVTFHFGPDDKGKMHVRGEFTRLNIPITIE